MASKLENISNWMKMKKLNIYGMQQKHYLEKILRTKISARKEKNQIDLIIYFQALKYRQKNRN